MMMNTLAHTVVEGPSPTFSVNEKKRRQKWPELLQRLLPAKNTRKSKKC
jgi:hypothetical protein